MAVFKYIGDGLHMSLHGSHGQRGKAVAFRYRMKDGTKVEHTPDGKPAFDVNDELTVTDERVIRHMKVDPRFELVSE